MKANSSFLRMTRIICFLVCICLPCSANSHEDFTENWWDNNALIVKGYGFAPPNFGTVEQGRIWARRAATLDGYRKLAEQAKAIRITAKETIGTQIITGDISEKKITALIHGAKIISEEFDANGNCTVVLSVPLYGVKDSVANIAFKPVAKESFPPPSESAKNIAKGNYTGLIIDCGDADLNPVLLPEIRNENNQSVYAYNNLDYDKIISKGMVSYMKRDDASPTNSFMRLKFVNNKSCDGKFLLLTSVRETETVSRAGNNPLIIEATALSDDNTCPVISTNDADKILTENQISHFLDEGSVVFTGYRVGGLRA